jgi:hypothetical protein
MNSWPTTWARVSLASDVSAQVSGAVGAAVAAADGLGSAACDAVGAGLEGATPDGLELGTAVEAQPATTTATATNATERIIEPIVAERRERCR